MCKSGADGVMRIKYGCKEAMERLASDPIRVNEDRWRVFNQNAIKSDPSIDYSLDLFDQTVLRKAMKQPVK